MSKIKEIFHESKNTIIYFIVLSILFFFLPFIMLFLIGMSTDSGTNSLSIYVGQDILGLIGISLMPFITFCMFYGIPGIIMFIFRKKLKFNLKTYIVLIFLYSLPFAGMLVLVHSNVSLEYKIQREKEILIEKGYIIEGTKLYEICNRYLKEDNINNIKALLELDSTILSYDYRYISEYMEDIDYIDKKIAMKRLEEYYGEKYIEGDSYHVTFTESLLKLSDILNNLRVKDNLSVEDVHNELNKFISGKSNSKPDKYTIDDDLERSIPLIVTYENIKLLNKILKVEKDTSYMQDLVLKSEIGFTINRVELFVKGNAYNYQFGEDITIEDNQLYIDYLNMLNDLISKDKLNVSDVKIALEDINNRYELNIKDRELNHMQVFFSPLTVEESKLQNES